MPADFGPIMLSHDFDLVNVFDRAGLLDFLDDVILGYAEAFGSKILIILPDILRFR